MVNNKCSVPYCPVASAGLEKRGKGRGNVTHFSFPKQPDLHDQWIAALNRDNFTPTTSSRVCEIHFDKEDFIPPKNPHKLHVVKRLKENCIPKRHLGDGGGLEEVSQTYQTLPNVELETVVTDGTVHYETIEQDISLRPPDVEQTIQIAEANVETIIVKMEDQGSSTEIKTDETTTSVATIKKLQPLKGGKGDEAVLVPQDVIDNTMAEVDFDRYLIKAPAERRLPAPGNNLEPEVVVPLTNDEGEPLNDEEKIEKLVTDLKKAYKKNQSMAKANKSLRLQLHQATKKTLSQKAKHEIVREIMSPFFTPTQIDCFCRPSWMRSRNWSDHDFELALTLRKMMSKKAFGHLRKKRVVPMPSLTSLRKYQRERGIVINHNQNRSGGHFKGNSKKKPGSNSKKMIPSMVPMKTISAGGAAGKVMQAINVPVSTIIPSAYEGQQIQIVNANGSTIGTVQGVLQGGSSQVQTIQLQVVDAPPPPPPTKIARLKANDEDNWKFIQVAEDGQTTTYIQQK